MALGRSLCLGGGGRKEEGGREGGRKATSAMLCLCWEEEACLMPYYQHASCLGGRPCLLLTSPAWEAASAHRGDCNSSAPSSSGCLSSAWEGITSLPDLLLHASGPRGGGCLTAGGKRRRCCLPSPLCLCRQLLRRAAISGGLILQGGGRKEAASSAASCRKCRKENT